MSEPIMTWNFFLTAILVPASVGALGLTLKKIFETWQAGWKQAEAEKEKNLEEWRKRLDASLNLGSATMQELRNQLQRVVTREFCEDSHTEMKQTLEDHTERITVLEVNVKHLQRQP